LHFRQQFLFPSTPTGEPFVYLAGNSLGLQPIKAREYINQELEDWAKFGVEGHLHARHPWLPYHEFVTESLARIVGARPSEVVAMNSLTVNLHLLMVSFYRPTPKRFRIVIESGAFPSDQYAVASQARFHGFDPKTAIVSLAPRAGESTLRTEDILAFLEREGDSVALLLLGNVNYLTGQAFAMAPITAAAQKQGCVVGWDLAHGAGNLNLQLHDWNVDFAAWCSYKYLNSGPGGIAGIFVHERHGLRSDIPRFAGWWGHSKQTRFQMGPEFEGMSGAEGWQLSNPPIFQLAALRASLELFDAATIPRLREKAIALTGYLEGLLDSIPQRQFEVITPRDPEQRGCQLSLRILGNGRELAAKLTAKGILCDFREPDIIRASPVPLYNSFLDVYRFAEVLRRFGGKA